MQSLGQPAGTRTRMWGNTVTYDAGKVLLIGGHDRTAEPADHQRGVPDRPERAEPGDLVGGADGVPRAFHNSVTLPTGEVIVIGGNTTGEPFSDNGAVYAAEIWNPDDEPVAHASRA